MNKRKWAWYISHSPSAIIFGAFGISTLFAEYEGHWWVAAISLTSALTLLVRTSMERMSYIIGWHDGLRAATDMMNLIQRGELPPDQAPHVEPWLRPSSRGSK